MKQSRKEIIKNRISELEKKRNEVKKEIALISKTHRKELQAKRKELYKITRNISANSYRVKHGYKKTV